MLNLRFIAGVGVGISGACGPPLAVWRARTPLPSALRSSAGDCLARQRAPVHEHRLRGFSVSLPPFMSHRGLASSTMYTIQRLSPPFSHLMLQKSLRQVSRVIRQTRLCRLAVFRVTPIVFAHNPSSFGDDVYYYSVTLPSSVPSQRTEELWRVKPKEMPTALPTDGEGDEGEVHYELFRSPQNTLLSTSKQGSFSRAASSWRRHRCACQPALTVPRTCGQAIRGM